MLPCRHILKQLWYPHFHLCTLTICSRNGNFSHPQWFPAHHRARNHGKCGTIWPNGWPVPNTPDRVEALKSLAQVIWLAVLEAWRAQHYLRLWLNGWSAPNAPDETRDIMQAHALISYPPLPISPCIPANPNTTTTHPHSSSSTSMWGQSITTTAWPPPIRLQNHAQEKHSIILEISLQPLSWLYCTSSF